MKSRDITSVHNLMITLFQSVAIRKVSLRAPRSHTEPVELSKTIINFDFFFFFFFFFLFSLDFFKKAFLYLM